MEHFQVAIIGAGMAGLGAAQTLIDNGLHNFVIIEAQAEAGGRIKTKNIGDSFIDLGAQWLHDSNTKLYKIAQEADLISSKTSQEGAGVYVRDDGYIFDEFLVKKIDFQIGLILQDCEKFVNTQDFPESLGDYLKQRFDAYLLTSQFDPAINELSLQLFDWHVRFQLIDNSCADLKQLSAKDWGLYSNLSQNGQCHINLIGGYQSLIHTLANKIPKDTFRFNCPVKSVALTKNKIKIICESNAISADHLMLTASLGVLKNDLQSFGLSDELKDCVERMGFGSLGKVFLLFAHKWWKSDGFQLIWRKNCGQSCANSCGKICTKSCGNICGNNCGNSCSKNCDKNCCSKCCGNNCNKSCENSCGNNCIKSCRNNCSKSCGNNCSKSCGNNCSKSCGNNCSKSCGNNCSKSCGNNCSKSCGNNCSKSCGNNCSKSCGNNCSKSCGNNCSKSCGNNCSKSCGNNCSKSCGNSCGNRCSNICSKSCSKSCENSCGINYGNSYAKSCGKSCGNNCSNDFGKNGVKNWTRHVSGFDLVLNQPKMLVGWVTALGVEEMERLSDDLVGKQAVELLRTFLKDPQIPYATDVYKTSWSSCKWTRGGYSHSTPACDHSTAGPATLAKPMYMDNIPRVLLAGEAAHESHFSTTHGAYESGQQQALLLVNHLRHGQSDAVL